MSHNAIELDREYGYLPEVAARMGISEKMTRKLLHDGDLPAIRVGRRYRFLWSDVEHVMKHGTGATTNLAHHVNAIVTHVAALTPDQRRHLLDVLGVR